MADESDARRDRIDALLQELGFPDHPGALLTGWVMVTTWATTEGETFIGKAHGASVLDWVAKGMHHEALFGRWPDD